MSDYVHYLLFLLRKHECVMYKELAAKLMNETNNIATVKHTINTMLWNGWAKTKMPKEAEAALQKCLDETKNNKKIKNPMRHCMRSLPSLAKNEICITEAGRVEYTRRVYKKCQHNAKAMAGRPNPDCLPRALALLPQNCHYDSSDGTIFCENADGNIVYPFLSVVR